MSFRDRFEKSNRNKESSTNEHFETLESSATLPFVNSSMPPMIISILLLYRHCQKLYHSSHSRSIQVT